MANTIEMKTLTVGGQTFKVVDEDARQSSGDGIGSYDLIIEADGVYSQGAAPKEAYTFNPSDVYNVYQKVKTGQNVNVLIKSIGTMDSSSTKYRSQFHPLNVSESYSNNLLISFLSPWAEGKTALRFGIDEANRTATLDYIALKTFVTN